MSILGLITEYNPFHTGHLYHFNTSMDITQAEYSICVMSGNFVQRGEPAIIDKWSRTLMALNAGVDLVIELPVIYSTGSAETFAYGAVSLLNKLGIVDKLCFGSEIGNLDLLIKIATIISSEPEEFREYIKEELTKGYSFPSSRAKALIRYIKANNIFIGNIDEIEAILKSPNNILGFEYVKWLLRLNSDIIPVTIKRMYSSYNDETLDTPLASATAIRRALKSSYSQSMQGLIPDFTMEILEDAFKSGMGPVFTENFSQTILCILRRMPVEDIRKLIDVKEGLEYRIKNAATASSTIEDLINNIKSKRYTQTRIKRILMYALIGIYKQDLLEFNNAGGPQYVRVLGFSNKGKKLLSMLKSSCNIPVITNVSDYKKYDNILLHRMIELDIRSTDIYVTSFKNTDLWTGGFDFYKKPLII